MLMLPKFPRTCSAVGTVTTEVFELRVSRALKTCEEESAIAPDGTAHGPAELIETQLPTFEPCAIREEIIGVQCVIAQKLKRRAVKAVRARFERHD